MWWMLACAGRTSFAAVVVDPWMTPELADGFDLPVGDGEGGGDYVAPDGHKFQGWYVATKVGETYVAGVHTGEDWNGRGGGDTDLGQPVRAIGRGRVVTSADFGAPWGGVVIVKHSYLEDGAVREISSVYAHLRARAVIEGQLVQRREPIGEIGTGDGAFLAHLHLELRRPELGEVSPTFWPSDHGHDAAWIRAHYEAPSAFIQERRHLLVPAEQPVVLLVDKSDFRARLFHSGVEAREVVIALGQDPNGDKVRQGDNRTPVGEYRVLERSRAETQ